MDRVESSKYLILDDFEGLFQLYVTLQVWRLIFLERSSGCIEIQFVAPILVISRHETVLYYAKSNK